MSTHLVLAIRLIFLTRMKGVKNILDIALNFALVKCSSSDNVWANERQGNKKIKMKEMPLPPNEKRAL